MRVRLRFAKTGKVRFTSHRDVARMWERGLRRAGLPVAYTEGYSPRPKVHFGLALPTAYESDAEYLDVDLVDGDVPTPVATLPERLTDVLPGGVTVTAAAEIDRKMPSLQEAVTSSTWRVEVDGAPGAAVRDVVDRGLAASTIEVTRTRKGKTRTDDVRGAVLALELVEPLVDGGVIVAELAAQPRALRPSELLTGLAGLGGPPLVERRVRRTNQWIESGGARSEPLSLPATRTAHIEARAS